MKKFFSIVLALAMSLSALPSALAKESENVGDYNSLRIPVKNEVMGEESFDEQTFSVEADTYLASSTTDNMASTGGSGGGGGSISGGGGASSGGVTAPDTNVESIGFTNPVATIIEGSHDDLIFTLETPLPGDCKMYGFAEAEDGTTYDINPCCPGETIEVFGHDLGQLPAGKYECYFYIGSYGSLEEGLYADTKFGPAIINVSGISLYNQYYNPSNNSYWLSVDLSENLAASLPSEINDMACTVDLTFKDTEGNVKVSMADVAVDNMRVYEWYGWFDFEFSFMGFELGAYTVDMTLNDENGNSYELGTVSLNITDAHIIDNISILHYDRELTPSTRSFYVRLNMNTMFVDYDKIEIDMVNSYGEVVAETVSKELYDISSYNGTEVLYKLNVIETLDTNGRYELDIKSDSSLDLITDQAYVYIQVSNEPCVVRAELSDLNIIKVFTENLMPGDYLAKSTKNGNESVYEVTIDDQGVGTFSVESAGDTYYYFDLTNADGEYIDGFDISVPYVRENSSSTPAFLTPSVTTVNNFFVRIPYAYDKYPDVSDIKSVVVKQNDEIVANVTNLVNDGYSISGDRPLNIDFLGTLSVVSGKQLVKGDAVLEVTYNNDVVSTLKLPVTDATTGLYGGISVSNSTNYNRNLGNMWCSMATGNNKASFVISNTNITSGEVQLWEENENQSTPIETLNVASLAKTTSYGFCNTYTGTFNTVLSPDKIYYIQLKANDAGKKTSTFTYYAGKVMQQYNDLTVYNNRGYFNCEDWINVSNINNVTFKAVQGSNSYNIPVTVDYSGTGHVQFEADFTNVPKGLYTLKAYDGTSEIFMPDNTQGYNYGALEGLFVTGCGWTFPKDGVRTFSLYGANLNLADDISVKLYKYVDFPEDSYSDKEKLAFVKDIEIAKPYNANRVEVPSAELVDLDPGSYTLVYMVNGEPKETEFVYFGGAEKAYSASVVVNDGISFTNKSEVEVKISASGYTQMKLALSEDELETLAYEPISAQKTVSFGDANGEISIYVQFANDDETETETVVSKITVDTVAPSLDSVQVPAVALWNSADVVFTTNELLRNAFLVVGDVNAENGEVEGRSYVFTLLSTENGVYTYSCNFYASSQYENITNVKSQIVALDKAGNKTISEVNDIEILLPRSISGTLTYGTDAVPNTTLYLYEGNEYVSGTTTNSNGEFTFWNITKGNYTIKVNKYGFEPATFDIAETEFGADITGISIPLTSIYGQNGTISVTVNDSEGAPVENAYVSVYSSRTGANFGENTDANGQAQITVPYQTGGTSYNVYVSYDNCSMREAVLVDSNKELTIVVPKKAQITGTVLSGDEKVANTLVIITGAGYETSATTDENGAFTALVYLVDDNRSFTVSANDNGAYSGSQDVTFEEGVYEATVTVNVKGNIIVKGAIKDVLSQPVTTFTALYFSGNGKYITVPVDENGEFSSPAVFGEGTYQVSAYGYPYKEIQEELVITAEDVEALVKELNVTAEKYYAATNFTTGYNEITATADTIAKGENVTFSVKFQNDGTRTLSNVTAYAVVPEGATIDETSIPAGVTVEGNVISKTVETMKADDTESFVFTVKTEGYEDAVLTVPAIVEVNNNQYPLGAKTVDVVSATLSVPKVVKKDNKFMASGEAVAGSVIEIVNLTTGEVLAITELTSKWYFAEIKGLSEDAVLVAKVTKDGKVGYSEQVSVKVEEDPIEIVDIKITNNAYEYASNEFLGYPTFSASVGTDLRGWDIGVAVSFANLPQDATVTYSFANKTEVPTECISNYFRGTIRNWKGSGTKKIIATVKTGDEEYEFILAEVIILIDPSGYVTDAETGEPIVGATVLLEEKSGDEWITWNAAPHKQQNPMDTDENGHYGWTVPEGEYRIIVSKDGYETQIITEYDSRDHGYGPITVLPVRTDIDIELQYARPVELNTAETKSVAGGKIKFVFTRPVVADTVGSENFKVTDAQGNVVAGTIQLSENNKVLVFKPTEAMADGDYTLEVSGIKDGSNNEIAAEQIVFGKQADIEALAAPQIAYNSTDGTITVTFAEGTDVVNADEIVVKNGDNVVSGTIREEGNVVTFIPDAPFTSGASYKVVVPDVVRTAGDNYLAAPQESTFTASGSGNTTPGGLGGSGGGGSSVSTVAKPQASVKAGEVEAGTKVALSTTTKNAKIYYTVDGTTPTEESTLYTEEIVIDKDMTIKAVAIKEKAMSSILSVAYTVKKEEVVKGGFADIDNYEWAKDAINTLAEAGIIKGVSETEFAPASDIKRADFMLLLVRLLGLEAEVTENFDDVASDKYYYEGIGIAKALGLTNGVGDNKFNPEESITRQDMFVLAYRILELQNVELGEADDTAINTFADYDKIADYATYPLAVMVKNELVKGSDNSINPVGNATRAETAVFINRLNELLNK